MANITVNYVNVSSLQQQPPIFILIFLSGNS